MILTVQSGGGDGSKWRLGIGLDDSREVFGNRGVPVKLVLSENLILNLKTSCGVLYDEEGNWVKGTKGYDLWHRLLSQWIVENGFHRYMRGQPTRLEFALRRLPDCLELRYMQVRRRAIV